MLEKAHEGITAQKILTKLWQIYWKVSHSVSRKYEIPRRTLQSQMKGTVREPRCAKLGRFRTILCEEMEIEIVHHAIDMQQRFYGLTPCDIRKLAFQLVEIKKLHHPFNSTKQWPPRTPPIVICQFVIFLVFPNMHMGVHFVK